MAAEALRSMYWFNPLLAIACRRLRQESEQACDDEVLRSGVAAPAYAAHLLDLARAVRQQRTGAFSGFPAPAMARPCSLERRVSAMLDNRLERHQPPRSARAVIALTILTCAVLIGGFGAHAQTFARFRGSVIDPMNREIPEVTVVLTNIVNHAKHEVRSDSTGRFEFVGLPPGDYLVEARFPGFATLKGNLTVTGGDVERTLNLKIGSLHETVTVVGSRGAAAVSAPRAREDAPARPGRGVTDCRPSATGGNIRPPAKLKHANPMYPAHLAAEGVTGTVVLAAVIDTDGSVSEVDVVGEANPDLASAALDAVRQWRFDQTLLNCEPVQVAMRVTVRFDLE
jgi:TonB family protein